jgi:hypothetical protein
MHSSFWSVFMFFEPAAGVVLKMCDMYSGNMLLGYAMCLQNHANSTRWRYPHPHALARTHTSGFWLYQELLGLT